MKRTENDLRDALRELEQRADPHGAPSTEAILSAATMPAHREPARRRAPRWLPPLAAAAVVAAAAVTAGLLQGSSSHPNPAGGRSHAAGAAVPPAHHKASAKPATSALSAPSILDDAAARLDATPDRTAPAPQDYFYVRTTEATTWTSVSGTRAGRGRTVGGIRIWVPGCSDGSFVAGSGQSGQCTLNDVPRYLADAPTTPSAWDAYLEHMAPGARAGGAQGKIIVQVLHEDLVAPKAAAALLRYTASCPGLHTLDVRPVDGEQLTGVTCTSMTNGSYGLAFDASTHALAGFVGVGPSGQQDGAAELVRQTGIVAAVGDRP